MKINIAAIHAANGGDYHQTGLFSNVQNFGSGWRVLYDHGACLILAGSTADGVERTANVARECVTWT